MAKKIDYPSKVADRLTKKLFKGKKGKAFREQLLNYMKTPNPPLGPASGYSQDLATQLYGPGGASSKLFGTSGSPGYLDIAANAQLGMLPAYTQAVQQGLSGNFFDIGPAQEFAERGLRRETLPAINQSFATLGSPLSSDTSGQITNAVRDTYLDLAAQDALMEFQAKQGLVNQGGMGAYGAYAQQPAGTYLGAVNQLAGAPAQLTDLDAAARAAQQSTRPGAASLFPSFISSTLSPLSQISSAGRTIAEV